MKQNMTTERPVAPWSVSKETLQEFQEEKRKNEQDRIFRGAQLYEARHGKSLAEELLSVADTIREGEACSEDNILFCSGTCDEAAEFISFVADCQRKQDLLDKKEKIADLCKEKAPKDPEALMGELDLAMDRVLSGGGDPLDIAESIGCAMDLIAQGLLHRDLPQVEEEPFELPGLLRTCADVLEVGDDVHPENTKFILSTVWDVLDHLQWDKKLPAGKRISQESLSFVSEKLLEVDEILAKLSKESMSENQTKLTIALAENVWRIMARLFPSEEA
jgi:hypothetical protein